jgi:hypothetical protein
MAIFGLGKDAEQAQEPRTAEPVDARKPDAAPAGAREGANADQVSSVSGAGGSTPAAQPAKGELVERLDGIRGWLGDLDRTVAIRSRIGLVLAAVAIGLGGAATYLALDARHQSASNSDVGALRNELDSVQGQANGTAEDVTALRSSVNAARSQAGSANSTASSLQAKIRQLRADVKDLQQSASKAAATPAPAGALPGTAPTTTTGTTTTPSGGGGGTGGGSGSGGASSP